MWLMGVLCVFQPVRITSHEAILYFSSDACACMRHQKHFPLWRLLQSTECQLSFKSIPTHFGFFDSPHFFFGNLIWISTFIFLVCNDKSVIDTSISSVFILHQLPSVLLILEVLLCGKARSREQNFSKCFLSLCFSLSFARHLLSFSSVLGAQLNSSK